MLGSMNLPAGSSADHASGDAESSPTAGTNDAQRRRRLDEIFGDVLPDLTGDERGTGRPPDVDHWYLENRPPHHG